MSLPDDLLNFGYLYDIVFNLLGARRWLAPPIYLYEQRDRANAERYEFCPQQTRVDVRTHRINFAKQDGRAMLYPSY